jgi:ABC-2 type transport system permease protein
MLHLNQSKRFHRVPYGAPAGGLLWGAGLAVGYVLLASWFFGRMYRHAVRTGLIAHYSAVSLS